MPQLYPNPISSTSYITINTGQGLVGGGAVQLGGSLTLSAIQSTSSVSSSRNCYGTTPVPDGTNPQFTIVNPVVPLPPYVNVYVSGLLQDVSAYSITGTLITFAVAPAASAPIYVVYTPNDTSNQYSLTPVGISTTNFQLPAGILPDSSYIDVYVAGVLQDTSAYVLNYISGVWRIVFGAAPGTTDIVAVLDTNNFSSRNLYRATPVIDGTTTAFTIHNGTPTSLYVDVFVNGIFKSSLTDYSLNIVAGVWQIAFIAAPSSGTIQVVF